MNNKFMIFGITQELTVTLLLAYVLPFNVVFGTRDCIYLHFGMVAFPIGMLIYAVE
jgi:sodium/potassium-transporting ATPase subunit alpha